MNKKTRKMDKLFDIHKPKKKAEKNIEHQNVLISLQFLFLPSFHLFVFVKNVFVYALLPYQITESLTLSTA